MVTREEGWTLAEAMVVVAILGIIFVIAPPLIQQTGNFFILGQAKLQIQGEARAAMYLMTRELRQAQNNTITIKQPAGQPPYSYVTFEKINGVWVTISQSGSTLNFAEGNNTMVLSKNLSYLAFTFPHSDDMTILTVSMTLQQQIYLGGSKALHMASEQVRIMN